MTKIKTSPFHKLIGRWTTTGEINSGEEHVQLTGNDSYALILDGNFVLHKADVLIGDEKSETFEVIGYDDATGHYTMQHYNNKGDFGVMTATVEKEVWVFQGEKLRFTGGFKKDDQEFSGIWEQLTDYNKWIHYMEIQLTRQ